MMQRTDKVKMRLKSLSLELHEELLKMKGEVNNGLLPGTTGVFLFFFWSEKSFNVID